MESQKVPKFEEFPEINLDFEDKLRIVKGLILILLFSSVCNFSQIKFFLVISSVVYYNAPNNNPNLIFERIHISNPSSETVFHENPVYRLTSRFISKNCKILLLIFYNLFFNL